MKLYYWDWDDSLKIEVQKDGNLDSFINKEYAEANHAFTNFVKAKAAARRDLDDRIEELKDEIARLNGAKLKLLKMKADDCPECQGY